MFNLCTFNLFVSVYRNHTLESKTQIGWKYNQFQLTSKYEQFHCHLQWGIALCCNIFVGDSFNDQEPLYFSALQEEKLNWPNKQDTRKTEAPVHGAHILNTQLGRPDLPGPLQTHRKQSWILQSRLARKHGQGEAAPASRVTEESCGWVIIMVKGCQELRGCVLNSEAHIPSTSCLGHMGLSLVSQELIQGRQHVSV